MAIPVAMLGGYSDKGARERRDRLLKESIKKYILGSEKDGSSLDLEIKRTLEEESAERLLEISSITLDALAGAEGQGASNDKKKTVFALAYTAEHRAGEYLLQHGKVKIHSMKEPIFNSVASHSVYDVIEQKWIAPRDQEGRWNLPDDFRGLIVRAHNHGLKLNFISESKLNTYGIGEAFKDLRDAENERILERYFVELQGPITDTQITFFIDRINGIGRRLIGEDSFPYYPDEAHLIAQGHLARLYDLVQTSVLRINARPIKENQMNYMGKRLEELATTLLSRGTPAKVSQTSGYTILTKTLDVIRSYQGFLVGKIAAIDRDAQLTQLVETAQEIGRSVKEAVGVLRLMRDDIEMGFATLGYEVQQGFSKVHKMQAINLVGMQALGTLLNHYGALQTGATSLDYVGHPSSFRNQFGNLLKSGV